MTLTLLFQAALVVASVGLGIFCLTLSHRLRKLNDLETGLGGAIAVMAAEVDRLERAIRAARDEATTASLSLAEEIGTARKERALWDLRRKINEVALSAAPVKAPRRLRKRQEVHDA